MNGEQVFTGPSRVVPTAAITVAIFGGASIMISPITPWLPGVAACGAVGVIAAGVVLILWLARC
jgi:hypothetical protein